MLISGQPFTPLPARAERVLEVVDAIPPGRVLSYGDVADVTGEGGARQVGATMARYGSMTAWWRVVRADGTLPERLRERALARYREEGTPMARDGVDMSRARWDGVPSRR